MKIIKIDTKNIEDWDTFHDTFIKEFGFPDFYGRNMNAWIDCMTYLDEKEAGMSEVFVDKGQVLTLQLENVIDFSKRCPELYAALIESSSFVNYRRIEMGHGSVIALSFNN